MFLPFLPSSLDLILFLLPSFFRALPPPPFHLGVLSYNIQRLKKTRMNWFDHEGVLSYNIQRLERRGCASLLINRWWPQQARQSKKCVLPSAASETANRNAKARQWKCHTFLFPLDGDSCRREEGRHNTCLALPCLVVSCPVFLCLVPFSYVLSCFLLSCLVSSCPILSSLVLSYLVSPCPALFGLRNSTSCVRACVRARMYTSA